ncbi:MAG: ATPase [Porphyromonadaceae bacterium]|nr:ATPase [Porphyromonadaceae bacterium]
MSSKQNFKNSEHRLFSLRSFIHLRPFGPAQLFTTSFLSIILLGSLLLLLPKATYENISYVDALFTATSAVCVTGLNVVDTELTFTLFGQVIIMLLIQIGGLGVMTITTYFSYYFKGGSSYKSQLLVKDITSEERLDNVFSSLKNILLITLVIEGLGFLLIFATMGKEGFTFEERVFFSIFHAISGFCNAGFSTLSGNLYDARIRFDYPVHLIISFLIIFGGLGFPIINNIWKYITNNIKGLYKRAFRHEKYSYSSLVISVNSHIVIITTLLLLIFGTFGFFIFEKDGVLTGYPSAFGKWTAAFFGSVTTRTAGFNSTDTAALSVPTALLFIVLMWIGASPASTGGGIKTSTLAIAFMNFMTLLKGKKHIEYRGREIPQQAVSRAFAQITLAILFIMAITFLMILIESGKEPLDLLFETVSAYGTVGLSRNLTPFLSNAGKWLIIATMFVGRVSLYTLLSTLTQQVKYSKYRYPKEEILIN